MVNWMNSWPYLDEQMWDLKMELKERIFVLTPENKANPNCIDGRDPDHGRPSLPGGKFGALWVVLSSLDTLLEWNYDRGTAIDIVKKYFAWNLWGHTDTHQKSDTPGCECDGCGHVYRLLHEWSERYDLSPESINKIRSEIADIDNRHIDVLEWNHEERSVIIVDSPGFGVKSHGKNGQDFVYNKWYADELYASIAKDLGNEFWILTDPVISQLQETAEKHVMTTAWDLAKWLPVFLVSGIEIDQEGEVSDSSIEHVWDVPE